LVLAAHPDDAELALGGSIARWADNGVDVTVAFFSACESNPEKVKVRIEAAESSADILGHHLIWLADPSARRAELVEEFEIVRLIDRVTAEQNPDVVIGHWPGDSHGDHVRMARGTLASSRRWPAATLLQFGPNEHMVPSYQEFIPNVYLSIADYVKRKEEALRAYSYYGQSFRELDLAGVRARNAALGSLCGLPAAEGLRLVRYVEGAAAFPLSQSLG
jgi:LmbE family N-acetylglucosaminyl deacetylase